MSSYASLQTSFDILKGEREEREIERERERERRKRKYRRREGREKIEGEREILN